MRLSAQIVSLAAIALAASPTAFACENPDDNMSALREVPPTSTEPDEFVLEIDVDSIQLSEAAPTSVTVGDHTLTFDNSYATFDVKRVVSGSFEGSKATIGLLLSSCWSLGAPTGSYLVAMPAKAAPDGTFYLPVRPISWGELRAQREASKQGAN